MIFEESYTLHNGAAIPKLALGTWFIDDDKAAEAVRAAVNIGYRHIDTAQAYGNERGVGEGIRTCGIDMENAKKFVDFMLSQKIQEAAGKTLTVRPLRKGVKLADYMTPQDTIALFKNYDEGWVAAHKKEVVAEWNKHLENSRQ